MSYDTNNSVKGGWWHGSALGRLVAMYREGFGGSRLARTLLWLVLVKVAILLLVFKLWLMPNRLSRDYDTDEERAQGVRTELLRR